MSNKKDFATSTVATAPSPADSGTSLVVASGHGARFPSAPFYVVVHPPSEMPTLDNAEKLLVSAKSTDTFTITRAQGDTTAKSIEVGWRISNVVFLADFPATFDDLTDGSTNKAYTATEKTKLAGIASGADVTSATNVGSSMSGASAKTTPVDADTMPLNDSAASNALKKVTWANLKAAIKSYYDSVTATMTNKTLTSPLVNKILDTNGNTAMQFNATASAVNYAWFVNGATGGSVSMRANGSDTNIPFALFSKGSGQVQLRSDTGFILTGNSVASGVNYLNVTSSIAGASPFMSAVGSDTNLDLNLVPKGTGNVTANGVPVVSTTGTQTLTSKTLTSPVINTSVSGTAIDTDGTLAANSDTKLASQKAVKTYVDGKAPTANSAYVFTDQGTTSTSYTDLSTVVSTSVTVGATGILVVTWSLGAYNASAVMNSSVALSGANTQAASDNWCTDSRSATYSYGQSMTKVFTGLTPGSTTVTMKFKTSSGTANFFNKLLNVVAL